MERTPLLEVVGVTKRFPGVVAVDSVHLDLYAGEVLALCGENGAGKSTLMKVLGGVHKPDSGEIRLDGVPVRIRNPLHAQQLGISIIHQELNLANNLTVAQNIFLGREPLRRVPFLLDPGELRRRAVELLERFDIHLDPDARVADLPVGQKQIIEIVKALSLNGRILIMDEPTAALSAKETERLFQLMQELRNRGVGIIFISHRLDEVQSIADRITVMRDGRTVGTLRAQEADRREIVRMMVDRDVQETVPRRHVSFDDAPAVLEVRHLTVPGFIEDVSFAVHKGEIVGLAGLVGSGRSEVGLAIYGALRPVRGEILFHGRPIRVRSPQEANRLGIGLVPEDRKLQGLVLSMTIRENISLASLNQVSWGPFIRYPSEERLATEFISALNINPPWPEYKVIQLSGGNQQKTAIAKALANKPSFLIVDEPTRGVDVGAKVEVHQILRSLAEQGIGILLISSDLPEVLALSDRVLVMRRGRIVAELSGDEATQEAVMRAATGL